jgi:hypothetical protein
MKHRLWILLIVVVAAFSTMACICGGFSLPDRLSLPIGIVRGSGQVVREEREIGNVSQVELQSFGRVHIELGERSSLHIEAEDNLLPYIQTEVREGRLAIKHKRGARLVNTEPMHYYVTVRELDAITVTGAGSVEVSSVQTGRLAVKLTGAGNVQIASLQAETLDLTISGAGGLSIEGGEVREQDIVISGAGDYRARAMDSRECAVQLSGMGSAIVRVSERLEVTISGAGSVQYVGDPEVEQRVTGVGRVQRIGE